MARVSGWYRRRVQFWLWVWAILVVVALHADIRGAAAILLVLGACSGGERTPVPGPETHAVGGSVSGLLGTGLELRLNGGAPLAVASDGPFTFPTRLARGASYDVTVATQPATQTCQVDAATGTIGPADVVDVAVVCACAPPLADCVGGAVDRCETDTSSDASHCGGCGAACNLAHASAACAGGACQVQACDPGHADLDGGSANGCEYACPSSPPQPETCNGIDDDCDGQIDEGLVTPVGSCEQAGPCAGAVPVCAGAPGWRCNYAQVSPHVEVGADGGLVLLETRCDGVDNNCNGQVDESFTNRGQTCTAGSGRCSSTGTYRCRGDGLSTECSAAPNLAQAVDEACNGVDDDCDGQIDERVPQGSITCWNGGAHACRGWLDPMVRVGSVWIYRYEASRSSATPSSAGTGTSRACATAGVIPWASVTQSAAAAACAAVTDSAGQPMRLCTAAEWAAACNLGVTAPTAVWSFATNPTVYQPASCNGVDAGLGGPWATGSGSSCYANHLGGRIYDLSGNVAEWTSTVDASGGPTAYETAGGAFGTSSAGTSCNAAFPANLPAFTSSDVGFRCCADNAP